MHKLYILLLITGALISAMACTENEPDLGTTKTINDALHNEWGASKEQIIGRLSLFSFSEVDSDLVTVDLPEINTTIGYQFHEGELCATLVVSKDFKYNYDSTYKNAVFLGEIGAWSISSHESSNTLIYTKNNSEDDSQVNVIGFAPIISDLYDYMPSIVVTTNNATNISYNTATVSGSVIGFSEQSETGIIYGKSSQSIDTQGTKLISNNHDNFTLELKNLSDNTTYFFKAYLKEDEEYFYGELKQFTTLKATTGEINGHTWVDLGLPSGLKWATTNVGAQYDADYGGWYAWGMTRTTSSYGSGYYDYYDSHSIPSNISGTEYDVARKNWGGSWRIPTFDEFKELYYECSFEWTTHSGLHGALFTGPNGRTIFLPAAGGIGPMYSSINNVRYNDVYGLYWSATLAYRNNGNTAKYFFFQDSGVSLYTKLLGTTEERHINTFNGMQIRPVTD